MTNRTFEVWLNNIAKRPALAATVSILWLILINFVAYGWRLGSIGLIDETEPLFAEASRQMFITGDWITPFFNGETRFDKPALIYWCQALAYAIFGVNEWAVRLPSAIAAMGLISLSFYTIYWYLSREDELENVSRPPRRWLTACLAAAIMAFAPEMIVWGRAGVSDMLLTGCMASALLCFFLAYAQPQQPSVQTRWYLAFYVLIAAAIVTKGPVGLVLPVLIIGAFLLYLGNAWQVLREMRLGLGMVIVLGLSLPWYVLVIQRNGWNYINSFFGYHNLERFTGVVNHHSAPWYFYFLIVLLGFAPYSIYLPVAIARLKFWKRSYWRFQERSQQLSLFALFWFFGVFGFFTIAVTKLPSYVLPLMPAAAILVALLWSDLLKNSSPSPTSSTPPTSLLWSGWLNVAFLSAIAAALFSLPKLLGDDPAAPNFRQLLQQSGLTTIAGAIWLGCAIILAILLLRRQWRPVLGVNLLGFAAFMIFVLTPALSLIDQERQLPLRQLSAIAVQAKQPNEELVMVGFKKPSVVFYTQSSVTYIKVSKAAGDYIRNQAGKKTQSASVLVLCQPKKFPDMGLQPSDYQKLSSQGAYTLIRVPVNNEQ